MPRVSQNSLEAVDLWWTRDTDPKASKMPGPRSFSTVLGLTPSGLILRANILGQQPGCSQRCWMSREVAPGGFCFGPVEGSRLPPGGLGSNKATRPAVTELRPSPGGAGRAVTSSPPLGGPARLLACPRGRLGRRLPAPERQGDGATGGGWSAPRRVRSPCGAVGASARSILGPGLLWSAAVGGAMRESRAGQARRSTGS